MKSSSDFIVSILTPTWNRANLLHSCWRGLCNQTNKSFEWIVVDDGSDDQTHLVMEELLSISNFPVTYARYNRRVGKCRADNLLLDLASGDFVIWCDSDDVLTENAINSMLNAWESIPNTEQPDYLGIIGLCSDPEGKIQSTGSATFEQFICTWGELSSRHGMDGDMCIMNRKCVVGNRRFPEHDLVMNESGFWYQFFNMKILCIPDILKVMIRTTSNRISGSRRMEYCRGKAYSIVYANSAEFSKQPLRKQISLASRYHRYSIHGDIGFFERNRLFSDGKTLCYYVAIIPGVLLAWKDILQGRVVKSHILFEEGKDAKVSVINNRTAEIARKANH